MADKGKEKVVFPLKVSALYLLAAGAWIIFSDRLLILLAADQGQLALWQTYKGFGFVLVTTAILYLLLRREWGRLRAEMAARWRTEEALQASEVRYRALFEHSMDAVLLTAPDGAILAANPAACRLFGLSEEDFRRLGRSGVVELEDPRLAPLLAERARTGRAFGEITFKRQDGSRFPGEVSSVIFQDGSGALRTSMVIRDVGERKKAEAEREHLQEQLLQARKLESVGRLAGGVAHDFNNMLSVIHGNAELALARVSEADELHTDLQEILKAAERSAAITRQLLAFARKQTVRPRPLELNETVAGMLKMLQRLIGEEIELEWRPGPGGGPVLIDPYQVDQLMVNLCLNARDAINGVGRITIETEQLSLDEAFCRDHPDFRPGDFVRLTVSDDGCGIEPETLENIFEPFFTTKEVGQGTGLGLATVYGIIKQNQGFIRVYSEPGIGATFKIYLPRHGTAARKALSGETAELSPGGEGECILLVEDEIALLGLAQRMLEGLGYRVLAAATPTLAETLAREHGEKIKLLLTDVVMPEMNGRDLARRLQSMRPELPVLYMSGYPATVIAHRGVLPAEVNFIQKPFSRRELALRVGRALAKEGEGK